MGLNSDRSVRDIKGQTRPILTESDRLELIAAMEMVNYVVLFDEPTPPYLSRRSNATVFGEGAATGDDGVVGADIVERAGGKVAVIPTSKDFQKRRLSKGSETKGQESVLFAAKAAPSATTQPANNKSKRSWRPT